jgi:hypothetical protein
VGAEPGKALFGVQVVEVDPGAPERGRGDSDDPAGCTLRLSTSSSRLVSRNGARWFTAKVVSKPSTVRLR